MNIEQQVEYLMRGTHYGDETLKRNMGADLKERLIEAEKNGRPLKVYCGFDPTSSDLHIGHTVPMRKLRQFQELGHEVVFLIGNYTSLIGDPSDKKKLRPLLSQEQVAENARTYAEQAFQVLEKEKTQIRYNAEWLSELSFLDVIKLASNFTIQQFLARENFKLRFDKNDPIFLHETFYSLMQGFDAYSLEADVQVGGTDQLFNIVTAARKLMTSKGMKPNIAIILDILPGTDGEIKMSKSLGNHIPLLSSPEDMYGKVMSVPDKAMPYYFRLVTRWTPTKIAEIESGMENGELHPRNVKMTLAYELVSIYHNEKSAKAAEEQFIKVFQKGKKPDNIQEYKLTPGKSVLEVMREGKLVTSNSDGRRMLKQNAVRFDGALLKDPNQPFPGPGILQVGKRKFLKIEI